MPYKDRETRLAYHRAYHHRNKVLTGKPPHWHVLSEVDEEARTGVCSRCGPTKLSHTGGGQLQCTVAAIAVRRRAQLKHKYGITVEQFEEMWTAQEGKCAVCQTELAEACNPAVDHCHDTGRVRGILCMPCNTALGKFGTVELLRAAIEYLEESGR